VPRENSERLPKTQTKKQIYHNVLEKYHGGRKILEHLHLCVYQECDDPLDVLARHRGTTSHHSV
jgi:hypothetical protein